MKKLLLLLLIPFSLFADLKFSYHQTTNSYTKSYDNADTCSETFADYFWAKDPAWPIVPDDYDSSDCQPHLNDVFADSDPDNYKYYKINYEERRPTVNRCDADKEFDYENFAEYRCIAVCKNADSPPDDSGNWELDDKTCSWTQKAPTCSTSQYLDVNNTCKDKTFPQMFNDFNDSKADDGFKELDSLTKEECENSDPYVSPLGVALPFAWNYQSNKCVVAYHQCHNGLSYNKDTKKCEFPPDDFTDPDSKNCPLNQFAFYRYLDLCSAGSSYVNPPPGFSSEDFLSGHKYALYRCIKDYRIYEVKEVSCGVPDPDDFDPIDLNITRPDQDLNGTLPPVDPSDAAREIVTSIDNLRNDISSSLKPILQDSNKHLDAIKGGISDANSKLTSIDSKLASLDKQAGNTNNLLNQINDKLDAGADDIDIASGLGNFDADTVDDLLGIDTSSLDESSDILDNLEDNLAYLTDNITSIKDDFEKTKSLLSTGVTAPPISSGSCSDTNLNKFGDIISPYSPAIALFVYITFMVDIFKMIFLYFSRSE